MTQQNLTTQKKEVKTKPNYKYMRDKDREIVKGIFRFNEVPAGELSFCYRAYKEDQTERYTFVDGHIYSIPLGVAKHLNKNGWYPVHQHAMDKDGNNIMKIASRVRRFGFQSLEFLDIDDLSPKNDIVTVESVGIPQT